MLVRPATIFGVPDSQDWQVVVFIDWQHSIIEQIGSVYRCFGGIKLGMGNLIISVDIGLLIDPSSAFDGADIEGFLTSELAWMSRFHFTTVLIIKLFFLEDLDVRA